MQIRLHRLDKYLMWLFYKLKFKDFLFDNFPSLFAPAQNAGFFVRQNWFSVSLKLFYFILDKNLHTF